MSTELETENGIAGYWICLNCQRREVETLRLRFNDHDIRMCRACAIALSELLIDALED